MITPDQIKEAVTKAKINYCKIRECSICDAPLAYLIEGEEVFLDTNCDCVSYCTQPSPASWGDLAEFINCQTNEDVRKGLAERFGLTI